MKSSKRTRKLYISISFEYLTFSSNTIFGFTEPGQGKNKSECQDSYSIIDLPEDHVKYFAVYDGHGSIGKSVSSEIISRMYLKTMKF
jgi:hypothetical protein